MSNGRAAPSPEGDEPELTIELRLPARMKLRDVMSLEEAMSSGVTLLVDWLVTHASADRQQLLDLDWSQIQQLRDQIKRQVVAASHVPNRTS